MGEAINLVEKVIFNCGKYNDLEKELINNEINIEILCTININNVI